MVELIPELTQAEAAGPPRICGQCTYFVTASITLSLELQYKKN